MSTTSHLEAGPFNQQAPNNALEVYEHLDSLSPLLDSARLALQAAGLTNARMLETTVSPPKHRLLSLDASAYPGGAFKFNGALFGLWCALQENPDITRVTTGTAGNFGATLGAAGLALGVSVTAYAPNDLNPTKRRAMEANGVDVRTDSRWTNVVQPIRAAEHDANTSRQVTRFMHPFNDPYAMKGQQMVGEQIVEHLLRRQKYNEINLQRDPLVILVQRGGGSLLTGVAAEIWRQKRLGVMGKNVRVCEVRPERLEDQSLDRQFDGLAVDQPGSWSRPIIENEQFVQAHTSVSRADVAQAASHIARKTPVVFEASGLAGLGAALRLAKAEQRRTTYVSILSGRNAPPAESAIHTDNTDETAAQRPESIVRPTGRRQQGRRPTLPGVREAYLAQLREQGIYLLS